MFVGQLVRCDATRNEHYRLSECENWKNGEEHHTRDKLTGWLITVEVRYTVIETCKRCNQGKD